MNICLSCQLNYYWTILHCWVEKKGSSYCLSSQRSLWGVNLSNLGIGLLTSSVENASYRGWTGETTMKNTSSFSSPSLLVSQVLLLFSAVCAGEIRHAFDLVVGRFKTPRIRISRIFHFLEAFQLMIAIGSRVHILTLSHVYLCLRREVVHKKGSIPDPLEVLIRLLRLHTNFHLLKSFWLRPICWKGSVCPCSVCCIYQ